MNNPQNYVEAFGARFPRSVCMRCGFPCVYLGEAIRVDLAEGGFTVITVCLTCVRGSRLDAACREVRAA
jgi:RNase P subunit RPR2